MRLVNISTTTAPCLHSCSQHCAAHKEVDAKVRSLREETKGVKKEYDKTEDDLKALQSVGQIIGEVLRQLDEERCEWGCCLLGEACLWACMQCWSSAEQEAVSVNGRLLRLLGTYAPLSPDG